MEGPFYVFPSGFAFNADALTKHVLPFLPVLKQVVVNALTQSIFVDSVIVVIVAPKCALPFPSSRHLPGF